jgi:glycolate oxidase FAD binding subunit
MSLQPQSVEELQAAILGHNRLTIRGCGTKSAPLVGVGAATLDSTNLRGITDYSPDECVFTALAGTPLTEIESTLAAQCQYIPFDPVLVRTGATLGGTVASGLSGSGRYRYGGVRDFVIGMRVVDGDGRLIRSGGKVVKNAAGFLLHHGMVGSLGRFGVIVDVTCKVFPRPEAHATLRVQCGSLERAWNAVERLQMARRDIEAIDFDSGGTLWVRIAGRSESVDARVAVLQDLLGGERISSSAEPGSWSDAREFAWVAPTESIIKVAAADLHRVGPTFSSARYFCAGTCVWIASADPLAIGRVLTSAGLRGQIVRGENAGALIGRVEPCSFETRVRRVLDPHNRFHAASDSSR